MKAKNTLFAITIFITSISFAQTGLSILDSVYVSDTINKYRYYRIYIPNTYTPSQSTPVVFNFHGYGSNAEEQESYGDFRQIADTANFLIVLPEGENGGLPKRNFMCFLSPDAVGKDILFTSVILDSLRAKYNVDNSQIFCTGFSNGGFMSYDLACQLSNEFAAMAPVSGIQMQSHFAVCNPGKALKIMHIHGTADTRVKYDATSGGITPGPPVHVDTIVKWWAENNNCNLAPTIDMLPDANTSDNISIHRYIYSGGDNETSVVLYKIIGGEHSWPGAATPTTGAVATLTPPIQDFNASLEIWKFFKGYDLLPGVPVPPSLSIKTNNNISNNNVLIFPNPSNGDFTLTIDNAKNGRLIIRNVVGAIVFESTLSTDKTTIELKAPEGVYFYSISDDDGIQSGKLIIN